AGRAEHLAAGPEVEVVGVAEDDPGLHVGAEGARRDGLHRAGRADGHEHGRLDGAVVGGEAAGAGAAVPRFEGEGHRGIGPSGDRAIGGSGHRRIGASEDRRQEPATRCSDPPVRRSPSRLLQRPASRRAGALPCCVSHAAMHLPDVPSSSLWSMTLAVGLMISLAAPAPVPAASAQELTWERVGNIAVNATGIDFGPDGALWAMGHELFRLPPGGTAWEQACDHPGTGCLGDHVLALSPDTVVWASRYSTRRSLDGGATF